MLSLVIRWYGSRVNRHASFNTWQMSPTKRISYLRHRRRVAQLLWEATPLGKVRKKYGLVLRHCDWQLYSVRCAYFQIIRWSSKAQMSYIDYQAKNTGSKKFRSSPYARVHWAKHQGRQWYTEEKANKFDNTISPTCRCCDEGKIETIRHVIQCKSRATIHEKKKKQFTDLLWQVEMLNDILKLLEGGIDLVLSGREIFRGQRWHDTDNIAQNDERIKAMLKEPSFREDAKGVFI